MVIGKVYYNHFYLRTNITNENSPFYFAVFDSYLSCFRI